MKGKENFQKKISIKGIDPLTLLGLQDRNLKAIGGRIPVEIVARGTDLILSGEQTVVEKAEKIFAELVQMITRGQDITEADLKTIIDMVGKNGEFKQSEGLDEVILYKKNGYIKPRGMGQQVLYRAASDNDIVFVVGPAGTGKTFLAVALAVAALRDKLVDKIVLTRPAVEAGERLGYLPGDFREKIDPYLRPLYDSLNEMIPAEKLKRYLESGIIEIVPLAYMRGRTLNNAFAILDEAQNTTFNQMKMFLTRLGINSRAIITGDVTQVDLPSSGASGLVQVQSILSKIEGIEFVYMQESDVVRHKLVRDIIKAYDAFQNNSDEQKTAEQSPAESS